MSDIVERLRKTTEQMACTASVDMTLWDKHSNACLEAAAEIERLRKALDTAEENRETYKAMSLRETMENARLRAENETLRAASGSLVRSLSGCWYAFEPSLRREMGNTNYHCVKEKMDEVEALLNLRTAAAALKETGDE